MKRAKHNLSHYKLATMNMGELIPVSVIPVLPGDTVQHLTSAMMRMTPLNAPVMHPTSVRIHHFFVPNRIVWDGWEDFITGGNDGQGEGETMPTINLGNGTNDNRLQDYIYGANRDGSGAFSVNALPLWAFNKVFNEFYRDQDLVPERVDGDLTVPRIAWEKDYFGVARPFTQRGPDVTIPIGQSADIATEADLTQPIGVRANISGSPIFRQMDTSGTVLSPGTSAVDAEANKLYADLTTATAASVNDFRAAFSLQRYQEARARYGARFTEYLRYLGIRPSDARLQRPEYLGGGTSRVNFSEVLQTAENPRNDPDTRGIGVADMYGHGIAGTRTNRYRKFFEEHGFIITTMSVRPKAIYQNGVPREFLKRTKEDYFQKELANLGQQEVYTGELYCADQLNNQVFGYTDRYEEYRRQPSQVHGQFKTLLNAYHMGRELDASVTLNESFITCDPSDRIFQVDETVGQSLWCFINHRVVARRLVPKRANPRIL
jgi:hypothetical protein